MKPTIILLVTIIIAFCLLFVFHKKNNKLVKTYIESKKGHKKLYINDEMYNLNTTTNNFYVLKQQLLILKKN